MGSNPIGTTSKSPAQGAIFGSRHRTAERVGGPIPHGLGDHARAPETGFGFLLAGYPADSKRSHPARFLGAGISTVVAVAYSHQRCRGYQEGELHPEPHSRVFSVETVVEPVA
jgi:hypothetical protein